jgi:hypothetical protein
MPHYYVHLHNSIGFVEDAEGVVLASHDIRSHAVTAARSIIGHEVQEGRIDLRGWIEVTERGGEVVLVLPFSEAVDIIDGPLFSKGPFGDKRSDDR